MSKERKGSKEKKGSNINKFATVSERSVTMRKPPEKGAQAARPRSGFIPPIRFLSPTPDPAQSLNSARDDEAVFSPHSPGEFVSSLTPAEKIFKNRGEVYFDSLAFKLEESIQASRPDPSIHYPIVWHAIHALSWCMDFFGIKELPFTIKGLNDLPIIEHQQSLSKEISQVIAEEKAVLKEFLETYPERKYPAMQYSFTLDQLERMSERLGNPKITPVPRTQQELDRFQKTAQLLILSAHALHDGIKDIYQIEVNVRPHLEKCKKKLMHEERDVPERVVKPFIDAFNAYVKDAIYNRNLEMKPEARRALLNGTNAEKLAYIYGIRLHSKSQKEIESLARIAAERAIIDVPDDSINPNLSKLSHDEQVLAAAPNDPNLGWVKWAFRGENDFFKETPEANRKYGRLRKLDDMPGKDTVAKIEELNKRKQSLRDNAERAQNFTDGVFAKESGELSFLSELKRNLYPHVQDHEKILYCDRLIHRYQRHLHLAVHQSGVVSADLIRDMEEHPSGRDTSTFDSLYQRIDPLRIHKKLTKHAEIIESANGSFLNIPGPHLDTYKYTLSNLFPLLKESSEEVYKAWEEFNTLVGNLQKLRKAEIRINEVFHPGDLSENAQKFKKEFLEYNKNKWPHLLRTNPELGISGKANERWESAFFSDKDLENIATALANYYQDGLDKLSDYSIQTVAMECAKRAAYARKNRHEDRVGNIKKLLWHDTVNWADTVLAYVRYNKEALSEQKTDKRNKPRLYDKETGKQFEKEGNSEDVRLGSFLSCSSRITKHLPDPRKCFVGTAPEEYKEAQHAVLESYRRLQDPHKGKLAVINGYKDYYPTMEDLIDRMANNNVPTSMNEPREYKPVAKVDNDLPETEDLEAFLKACKAKKEKAANDTTIESPNATPANGVANGLKVRSGKH